MSRFAARGPQLFSTLVVMAMILTGVEARANLFTVYIDRDRDPATGCGVDVGSGPPLAGIDVKVEAGVDQGTPPRMVLVGVSECDDPATGAFGPTDSVPVDTLIGLDIGRGGSDVVEFDRSLAQLGIAPSDTIDLTLVSGTSAQGTPDEIVVLDHVVSAPGGTIPIAVRDQGRLHRGHLPEGSGAKHISDGRITDWRGTDPLATSPEGGTSTPATDVRGMFVAEQGGRLYFRVDVADLEGGSAGLADKLAVRASVASTAIEGQKVTLNATVSGADGEVKFSWRQTDGPDVGLRGKRRSTTSFMAPAVAEQQTLEFEVTVRDDTSRRASSRVTTVVGPDGIFVSAGKRQSVPPGSIVSLHAKGQGDGGSEMYHWVQLSPPTPMPTLVDADTRNPSFVAPAVDVPTTFVFEVVFTDGLSTTANAVEIEVFPISNPSNPNSPLTMVGPLQSAPLLVVAPPAAQVPGGTMQPLAALASGGDGAFSWHWKFKGAAGPGGAPVLGATDQSVLSVTLPTVSGATTYAFEVEVTDGTGTVASGSTSLFVDPTPGTRPLDVVAPSIGANEGPLPVSISASAQGGTGPYTYRWMQTGGPPVTLEHADTATASFVPPGVNADTTLTFQVTATDSTGASVSREMNALVRNIFALHPAQVLRLQPLPLVEVLGGESARLAVGVTGGTPPYSWQWTQLPGASTATLSGADTDTLTVGAPVVGTDETLEFEVTVTDSASKSATATVQVKVLAAPSTLPLSVARIPLQYVDEGTDATLAAVATGGMGGYTYDWQFVPSSGVPSLPLTDAGTSVVRFTAPQVSARTTLLFRLTIGDGTRSVQEDVTVIVNDLTPPLELRLLSQNTIVSHPGDRGSLIPGRARGGVEPYSYAWTQTVGPMVTLTNADTPNAILTAPAVTKPTTLVFVLTVTDAVGNTISVSETVTANPPSPLQVTLSGPDQAQSGDSIRLSAHAFGGMKPFVSWSYHVTGVQVSVPTFPNPSVTLPAVTSDTRVTFTVIVHDSATPPNTAQADHTMWIFAPAPTPSPVPTATPTPSPMPTAAPTGAPTAAPTVTPTPTTAPTASPTPPPAGSPTPAPMPGHIALVCGDQDVRPPQPCSDMELVLAIPSTCPPDKPYAMNDIYQKGTEILQFRRCVDEVTCYDLWFQATSDNPLCLRFDPQSPEASLDCHLCCLTPLGASEPCNLNNNPPDPLLYRP